MRPTAFLQRNVWLKRRRLKADDSVRECDVLSRKAVTPLVYTDRYLRQIDWLTAEDADEHDDDEDDRLGEELEESTGSAVGR